MVCRAIAPLSLRTLVFASEFGRMSAGPIEGRLAVSIPDRRHEIVKDAGRGIEREHPSLGPVPGARIECALTRHYRSAERLIEVRHWGPRVERTQGIRMRTHPQIAERWHVVRAREIEREGVVYAGWRIPRQTAI
jgi:hypothetical protein